jgi:hypothetical protein
MSLLRNGAFCRHSENTSTHRTEQWDVHTIKMPPLSLVGWCRWNNPIGLSFNGSANRYLEKKSVAWVRERTIQTERLPLVGEVSANFCGVRVPHGQRDGSLWPYSRFSRQEPLLFYQVAPQLYSRGWVDPVPDPPLLGKSGSVGNWTRTSGSVARNSDH